MRHDRKAPGGQFRAHLTDTFDMTDWVRDFPTQAEAVEHADEKGDTMLMVKVYDDQGRQLHQTGTF